MNRRAKYYFKIVNSNSPNRIRLFWWFLCLFYETKKNCFACANSLRNFLLWTNSSVSNNFSTQDNVSWPLANRVSCWEWSRIKTFISSLKLTTAAYTDPISLENRIKKCSKCLSWLIFCVQDYFEKFVLSAFSNLYGKSLSFSWKEFRKNKIDDAGFNQIFW